MGGAEKERGEREGEKTPRAAQKEEPRGTRMGKNLWAAQKKSAGDEKGKRPQGRRKKKGRGEREGEKTPRAAQKKSGKRVQICFGGCGILNASKGRARKSRGQ